MSNHLYLFMCKSEPHFPAAITFLTLEEVEHVCKGKASLITHSEILIQ